jgi:hypothetical protein
MSAGRQLSHPHANHGLLADEKKVVSHPARPDRQRLDSLVQGHAIVEGKRIAPEIGLLAPKWPSSVSERPSSSFMPGPMREKIVQAAKQAVKATVLVQSAWSAPMGMIVTVRRARKGVRKKAALHRRARKAAPVERLRGRLIVPWTRVA